MISRILIPVLIALLAIGAWFFAGYLMGDRVDCTGRDLISFPIKCADVSLIRLVDTLRLLSVALGLSSVLLLILFWRRRPTQAGRIARLPSDSAN